MSETTVLRTSAIVQNAAVGTTRPAQVNTGDLPLVQMKGHSARPQVQEGQQKPMQIVPSKNLEGVVQTGALPMVMVKMTQNGPQRDDGQTNSVVIRDHKQPVAAAGALPMVQVKMTQGGPQVQNEMNVRNAGPQIQTAPTALSQPRGVRASGPQVQLRPVSPVAPVAAVAPQVFAPPSSPPLDLSADQILLCRHLVDKYLVELRDAAEVAEGSALADNVKLAEDTIFAFDQRMAATTAQAQVAAEVVAAPVAAQPIAAVQPAPVAHTQLTRKGPARGFTMPGIGGRRNGYGGRAQNGGLAPRRVVRNGPPLPMVHVKMDGERSVVQNQAEVLAAKQAEMDAKRAQAGVDVRQQAAPLTDDQILAQARVIAEAKAAAEAAAQATAPAPSAAPAGQG